MSRQITHIDVIISTAIAWCNLKVVGYMCKKLRFIKLRNLDRL